ncbi:hypothetical protein M9Y10_000590 [Tritrichomonas musculus]|uniref:F5/8 type C domain-containing protein n=1 Tax=Tritrichomonas musculus TaxID=1915356 RepID=A0ABR2L6A8_9EUKA
MSIIKLNLSSILEILLQTYKKDFLFIVNGKEYKTSRLVADLLSPIICKLHFSDPTASTFTITTQNNGNFLNILELVSSKAITFTDDEIPYLSEIIKILGNNYIEYEYKPTDISVENVLKLLQFHEQNPTFFYNQILREIEFASSHFTELFENRVEEIKKLSIDTFEKILKNDHLILKNEDQLLKIINTLYSENSKYSILYETVLFSNVSAESMKEFVTIFDMNEMTFDLWEGLSKRLCEELKNNKNNDQNRYKKIEGTLFEYKENEAVEGIFNYFQKKTNGKIEDEINFTASSVCNNSYDPRYVASFTDDKGFESNNVPNSWICFDFKMNRVNLTHYTIRTYNMGPNNQHPKNWVIEGSNDLNDWEMIDEENNCPLLNGANIVHTFAVNNPIAEYFKYIRMRTTGKSWQKDNFLAFKSFEIYGSLIKS